jgi:L-fuculose-phosphate aldolase
MRKTEQQLREELVRIGQLMYQKGFIAASDGNVSVRLDAERVLITPSGLHKGLLEPDDLVVVDMDGRMLGYGRHRSRQLRPTSELPMHLEAYRLRPDINAVVHAHPPIAVALSIAGIPLNDCLLPEVIVFLGLIPTTAYATPSSEENVRAIREFIGHHDGLVLQRHGSLTVGKDPMQAFMRLETLEQQARMRFMLAQLGAYNPMPPEEIRKLLAMRVKMGLAHPGEEEMFCTQCGVNHLGDTHLQAMQPNPNAVLSDTAVSDEAAIRQKVAQIVASTLGKTDGNY